MSKRLKRAAAAALLLGASLAANAAGLGRLTVLSNLGQPFRGEVDLVSVKKDELSSLNARIASPDAFRQADLPFTAYVSNLKVSVQQRPNGEPFVQVSAAQPLNEPFIDFLVELWWSSGRLVRAYTALVDPPAVTDSPETQNGDAATVKPVAPQPEAAVESVPAPAPSRSVPESPVPRPQPQPVEAQARDSAPKAPEAPAPQSSAPATPAAEAAPQGSEYGPVKRGDTLSKIARENKPADVTLEQMLVALYRSNPDAFAGKNMNRLKTGKILRVPAADEAVTLTAPEARKEVRLQASNWNAYRERLAGAAESGLPADAGAGRLATGKVTTKLEDKTPLPAEPGQDVLKLSKGEPSKGTADKAPPDSKSQDRIRALEEEVAAKGKAVADANQRVVQLEKQIKDLQALVEMKSKGMADLQKPPAKPEAPATLPPILPAPKATEPAPAPKAPEAAAPKLPEILPPKTPEPAPMPGPAAGTPPVPAETPAAAPSEPAAPAEPAPPPKPKRKFVPPPPPPPPSLVDQILGNPMVLGGVAVVVAALAGLGFMSWKRKKGAGRSEPSAMDEAAEAAESEDSFGPAGFGGAAAATAASAVAPATGGAGDESDALAEAEVFLIYGRDSQAEERLKEAIAANPQRLELHAKLLEIYAKRNDPLAFEEIAKDVQMATGSQGENWEKVARLGYQVDPGNPRYASGKPSADDTMEQTIPGMESTVQMESFDGQPKDDLDFNLDFESTSSGSSTDIDLAQLGRDLDANPATTTDIDLGQLSGVATADDVFDPSKTLATEAFGMQPSSDESQAFDPTATIAPTDAGDMPTLPGVGLGAAAKPKAGDELDFEISGDEATLSGTTNVSSMDDLGFDLDTLKLDSPPLESPESLDATRPGTLAPANVEDTSATMPGGAPDLDLSSISLELGDTNATMPGGGAKDEKWYDVQTKFDLAKAYQEMGDKEGAREILEEVIAEGDAEQQQAARDLLTSLG